MGRELLEGREGVILVGVVFLSVECRDGGIFVKIWEEIGDSMIVIFRGRNESKRSVWVIEDEVAGLE